MRILEFSLLFLLTRMICVGQSWQQLGAFPAAGRDDGSVSVIGNKAYCGLGNAQGVGPSADLYKFDLVTESWAGASASLPTIGRQYCCSFSSGAYGFIATGVDANWNATNEVWRYDTLADSWMQKTSMPDSVQGAACFFINNKAYICGGRNQANQCTKKVWEYDVVNDSWQQKNDMPDGGRWRASVAVVNGKGYLLFGADASGKFSNKLYEYDAAGDAWALIDSFPGIGRTYAAAGAINNFLVVALGIDSANAVHNDLYLYDVIAHQWIVQNALPSFGRKGCMAFTHNNVFYMTAGIDGSNGRLTETWKAGNVNEVRNYKHSVEIGVYPDPADAILFLREENECSVIRVDGVEVIGRARRKQVDVSDLPAGIYFLRMQGEDGAHHKKFVVAH